MATTCDLRPFRDYDEHNVINLFAYSGSLPVKKGTIVKIVPASEGHEGWKATDELQLLGDVGASYTNTVSERYGVAAKVTDAVNTDEDNAIGMLLYDVKETDENGEKLIFNPRKAAELQVALSGQAVPVVTKGIFLYKGIDGTPAAGGNAYIGANGILSATAGSATARVGQFLGAKDADSNVLVKLEIPGHSAS